jgi:hypothetical protein
MRLTTVAKAIVDRIRAWYRKAPRNQAISDILRGIWYSDVTRAIVDKIWAWDNGPADPRDLRPIFCREAPSNQAISDILQGIWYSEFPDEYQVKTGGLVRHFDFTVDGRVKWVHSVIPDGLRNRSILELGPFEAYNTWQMEKLGAKSIVAIESNNLNFLKCLLVKEITRLQARFLYGDFEQYLQRCEDTYDLVWASGVLYHQTQPLQMIDLVGKVTSKVFVSTHYYHDSIVSDRLKARHFMPERDSAVELRGLRVPLHYRSYRGGKQAVFSGGIEDFSYWITKDDMLEYFHRVGFSKITVRLDDPVATNGPVIQFLAEKEAPTG